MWKNQTLRGHPGYVSNWLNLCPKSCLPSPFFLLPLSALLFLPYCPQVAWGNMRLVPKNRLHIRASILQHGQNTSLTWCHTSSKPVCHPPWLLMFVPHLPWYVRQSADDTFQLAALWQANPRLCSLSMACYSSDCKPWRDSERLACGTSHDHITMLGP